MNFSDILPKVNEGRSSVHTLGDAIIVDQTGKTIGDHVDDYYGY